MNLQEFKGSGLLESYILGHCNAQESALVEQMLRQHAELRTERDAIEAALEQYAQARAVSPPAWLKGKIMDEIGRASGTTVASKPGGFSTLSWVAIPLLFGAIAFGYMQFQRNGDLRQEKERTEQQLKACDDEKTGVNRLQAFLLNPDTRTVRVQWADTTKTAADGVAIVYDNRPLGESYVQVVGMPTLPADQDYQFWIITKNDPNPVPFNVFQANSGIFNVSMREEVAAFAVSIEPKGGSPNGKPTTVIMVGT
jgi:anti-sigma-K factor RskA